MAAEQGPEAFGEVDAAAIVGDGRADVVTIGQIFQASPASTQPVK